MKIANTIGDVTVGSLATDLGAVMETLRDVDDQRIAKTDDVVIRKGVLALLELVGRLEERVVMLERSCAGGKTDADGESR